MPLGTNDQKTHTRPGKYLTGSTAARWWPVRLAVRSIVGVAKAVPSSRSNGTGTDLQRLSTWTLRRWGKRSEPAPNSGIRALLDYAVAHGFTPAQVTGQQCRAWCPPNHMATREEAFGYALAMLQSYIPA